MNSYYKYTSIPKSSFSKKNVLILPINTGEKYPNQQKQSSRESVLKKKRSEICSKFIGEHPCQSVILIKLLFNFIEIALWHGCSSVVLLHIFRTSFHKNTSGELLLNQVQFSDHLIWQNVLQQISPFLTHGVRNRKNDQLSND